MVTVGNKGGKAPGLDEDMLAVLCKALGHPARIKIIRHLKEVNKCICGGIVEIMPLAQSTVSRHLKVLKEAGLVKGEIDGPRVCYCLDPDMIKRFKQAVRDL